MGLLGATLLLGIRHGIDWDHIAAITDLTSSQTSPRRSLWYSTLYALGHALVVLLLGVLAIVAGDVLPDVVDRVMEPIVGVTLVALGLYVLISLARDGRDFRMRSRWMLVFSGVKRLVRIGRPAPEPIEIEHEHEHAVDAHGHDHAHLEPVHGGAVKVATKTHTHRHRHVARMPDDPFVEYGRMTSFAVGMLHGVGAETPTQILLFVTASKVGGQAAGVALLVTFILGILISNSAIAVAGTFGFSRASGVWPVYVGIAVVTALFSLSLGILYLLGDGGVLPAILT